MCERALDAMSHIYGSYLSFVKALIDLLSRYMEKLMLTMAYDYFSVIVSYYFLDDSDYFFLGYDFCLFTNTMETTVCVCIYMYTVYIHTTIYS